MGAVVSIAPTVTDFMGDALRTSSIPDGQHAHQASLIDLDKPCDDAPFPAPNRLPRDCCPGSAGVGSQKQGGDPMVLRDVDRLKDKIEVSLDSRQIFFVFF